MNNPRKVIGYVRVSTAEQGLSGAGLQVQRDAITADCARRGWELVRIEEDVLSGKSMKRPGLQAALADCESGRADGLIAAKLDRLSRSTIDFLQVLERATKRGYVIVVLDIGLDMSTPNGKALAGMMAVFAQWERELIGQRTKDALAVKRAQGVTLGRPVTIDAALARRIRGLRSRGKTLQAICDKLNGEGVPTARGGAVWRPTSLRAVLR